MLEWYILQSVPKTNIRFSCSAIFRELSRLNKTWRLVNTALVKIGGTVTLVLLILLSKVESKKETNVTNH